MVTKARAKEALTIDSLLFSTPEQKLFRFLLTYPTTSFQLRVVASRLKTVRNLGGAEGIKKILLEFERLGLVKWVDNGRAIKLNADSPLVPMVSAWSAIGSLETLFEGLRTISDRVYLIGSRSRGQARSDSDYDVFVVTTQEALAKQMANGHPMSKEIEIIACPPSRFSTMASKEPDLFDKITRGIQVWDSSWGP